MQDKMFVLVAYKGFRVRKKFVTDLSTQLLTRLNSDLPTIQCFGQTANETGVCIELCFGFERARCRLKPVWASKRTLLVNEGPIIATHTQGAIIL